MSDPSDQTRDYLLGRVSLGALLLTVVIGCGGVLDYRLSPLRIEGELQPPPLSSEPGGRRVVMVQAENSSHLRRLLSTGVSDWNVPPLRRADLVLDASGRVEHTFPPSNGGCPFLIIPPLFTLLCDFSKYAVVYIEGVGVQGSDSRARS